MKQITPLQDMILFTLHNEPATNNSIPVNRADTVGRTLAGEVIL
jgi:hypothetical protein